MAEESPMAAGVIPLRPFPSVVKLPRRYEKAAMGDPKTASRYRRVSLCAGPVTPGEGMPERVGDLTTAIMWVKQELISLRQHDILLKRQFFNIQHSIRSLQHRKYQKTQRPLLTPPTKRDQHAPLCSSVSALNIMPTHSLSHLHDLALNRSEQSPTPSPTIDSPTSPFYLSSEGRTRSTSGRLMSSSSDYCVGSALFQSSTSVSGLNHNDDGGGDGDADDDGDDTFDEDFFRPRTSSMRTSRDLAALARRRGSKELI